MLKLYLTGDACIRVNEIDISFEIAQRVTFEEKVNIHKKVYHQNLADEKLCLKHIINIGALVKLSIAHRTHVPYITDHSISALMSRPFTPYNYKHVRSLHN